MSRRNWQATQRNWRNPEYRRKHREGMIAYCASRGPYRRAVKILSSVELHTHPGRYLFEIELACGHVVSREGWPNNTFSGCYCDECKTKEVAP